MTTQNQLDTIIGKNTGTYLKNLDEDYNYVRKLQPMFSKPGSRSIRWYVDDCFLRFWFRYILPNQALIEMGRHDMLREIMEKDYCDYTGHVLEQYFRQKYLEEKFLTIKGEFCKYKQVDKIGLSMMDM